MCKIGLVERGVTFPLMQGHVSPQHPAPVSANKEDKFANEMCSVVF